MELRAFEASLVRCQVARGLCYKQRAAIGPKGEYQPPASVDYERWLGPAPLAGLTRPQLHYDWHWQWPYGNGDLGNQGIHHMDLARWGLGVNGLSNSVVSYGGRFGYEDAGETANTQVVIHEYGDRTLVFEVRGLETGPYKGAQVGVVFEAADGYVASNSYGGGAAFDPQGKMIEEFTGPSNDDLHFENFLGAVRSRKHEQLHADILEDTGSAPCAMWVTSRYRLGVPTEIGAVRGFCS